MRRCEYSKPNGSSKYGAVRGRANGCAYSVPKSARPASLLLALSGSTVADVLVDRETLKPHAARLLAPTESDTEFDTLERMIDENIPPSYVANELSEGSAAFHLRLVQLCGNATLVLLVGMMHEIFERHVEAVTTEKSRRDHGMYESKYLRLIRSCRRLSKLLRARDAAAAFAHWQQHMTVSRNSLLFGHESTQARGVLD